MKPFILFQYLAPQHLLSRLVGALAKSEVNWVKSTFINRFAKRYQIDMSQAENSDLSSYPSFNAFFTRALKAGARPITEGNTIASPADGAISQLGDIKDGRIFQAKGFDFSAEELLGDNDLAQHFTQGKFATIYLSPRDYHRVHMPISGELTHMNYIAGKLFSVNGTTAENVPRLFARNERVVALFDTEVGPVAAVLVGAMIVAGIETVWSGPVAPNDGAFLSLDYRGEGINLNKGDEMGRFMLGSTVVLLFPDNSIEWNENLEANSVVRMGESIAAVAPK